MRNFHGANKKHRFFEGWYLKQESDGHILALIPAYHVDDKGRASASVQIITERESDVVYFPASQFAAARERFFVKIGDNEFSDTGVKVNLRGERLSVTGKLQYTPFQPPRYDMMGPFRHIPWMECNHGVVSLSHRLSGSLVVQGKTVDFTGGLGYIEKDWGRSFPSAYLWTQCAWPGRLHGSTVMVSVADIPMLGGHFTGCIGAVWHGGREYRLATYCGASVRKCTGREVVVSQGNMRLQARLLESCPQPLHAPVNGGMSRVVHESPACRVRYRFWKDGRLLFDRVGTSAGFETAAPSSGNKNSGRNE